MKFDEEEKQTEKEAIQYYLDFVSRLNSNPKNDKQAKQTEKFLKEIKPRKKKEKSNLSGEDLKNKYQWNDRVRKKIEAKKRNNKNLSH